MGCMLYVWSGIKDVVAVYIVFSVLLTVGIPILPDQNCKWATACRAFSLFASG